MEQLLLTEEQGFQALGNSCNYLLDLVDLLQMLEVQTLAVQQLNKVNIF